MGMHLAGQKHLAISMEQHNLAPVRMVVEWWRAAMAVAMFVKRAYKQRPTAD